MDEKQKNAAAEEAEVTLAQKILGMTEDELVEAVAMGVAWLSLGGPDKQTTEGAGAVIKGLAQAMEPGFRELMTQMPWGRAVWEMAGTMFKK